MRKLFFCSLLDFGIEVKGLWASMDKTYMMTRTVTRKNIVNQANFLCVFFNMFLFFLENEEGGEG